MDLKQFRYFTAIVENGSYARAADACNVSQPAISASISQLEAEVAVPLLERGAFGARPTRPGRALYERAKLVLAEVERTRNAMASLRKGDGGNVVIGVSPMTEHALAPAIISDFAQQWPGVNISVLSALSDELFERLSRGELDLVFNSPPNGMEQPPGLDIEVLRSAGDVVVGAADHPLTRDPDWSLDRLAAYKWIITGRATQTIHQFFAAFRDGNVPLPAVLARMDSFPVVARMVTEQDFLFVISPILFDHLRQLLPHGDALAAFDVPELSFPRRICLATRQGSVASKATQEMIALIRAHVAAFVPVEPRRP